VVVDVPQTHRKLAAILSADVAGFSRLMGADEVGTLRALTGHRTVVDGHIARHGGRIVGTAGDSVLADFQSVVSALEAAVAIQRDIATRNRDIPTDRRLQFRIGINLGDVIVETDTIYGDGVNIAARLQALAQPGGIFVSGSVHEQVRNKLDLRYGDLGLQRVKNIAKPVRVFSVATADGAPMRRNIPRAVWAGAGALVLIVAAALAWRYDAGRANSWTARVAGLVGAAPTAEAARPVVAVLPFADLGGDASEDYFSDGLADDVIGALGRFSDLAVIAKNSAFAFRNKPATAREIGRALGARYLVEGSVRKSGERVRVAVQLIEAENSLVRWSDRYDSEIKDIFGVQDEITRGVVRALATRLNQLEEARLLVKKPANFAAYEYVLRGRQELGRTTRESNHAARSLFNKAMELDPAYAPAYVGLGHTYVNAVAVGWAEDPVSAIERAADLGVCPGSPGIVVFENASAVRPRLRAWRGCGQCR
jgi:TolB-like protein/class 3 adenylate cyclase